MSAHHRVGTTDLSGVDALTWINELPDGLLVCTPTGQITVANSRLATMSGYSVDELIGSNVDMLVPAIQRSGHKVMREGFVDAGVSRPMGPGQHLTLARADGNEIAVEISLSPLVGLGASELSSTVESTIGGAGVVAIVRDVTDRLRVEVALRNSSDLLTLADERERIARDLHDTVLQRLFGLGMELQAVAIRSQPDAAARIESAVDEIDLIIREIRTAVFTFGSAGRAGSLGQELSAVTSQAKRVLGFAPRLRMDGPVETAITPEIRVELLASLREALTNVARHANATEAEIELQAHDVLVLRVLDNGRSPPADFDMSSGNGLRNMVERARLLGGDSKISPRGGGRGCELHWWVPLHR